MRRADMRWRARAALAAAAVALFAALPARAGYPFQEMGLDWSLAGYPGGRIPHPPATLNATDFGAVDDPDVDSTAALQAAIDAAQAAGGGVVYVPRGMYKITRPLFITASNTVLRGAGSNKTVFYVPKSLTDVFGDSSYVDPCAGNTKGRFAFGGGFVVIQGSKGPSTTDTTRLATVISAAPQGSRVLKVSVAAASRRRVCGAHCPSSPPTSHPPRWMTPPSWLLGSG